MVTGRTWIVAAHELTHLSAACPCGTVTTFDMTREFEEGREIVCARCARPMMGLKALLLAYRAFYRLAAPLEDAVRFPLKGPTD